MASGVMVPTSGSVGGVLGDASRQWASRPADERFNSVEAMKAAIERRMATTRKAEVPWSSLAVVPGENGLVLQGKTAQAELNWHAMGQLCARAGAPASFVRELRPDIAAMALNYQLAKRGQESGGSDTASLLLSAPPDQTLVARAILTPTYTWIWDLDVAKRLVDLKAQGVWQEAPAAFDGSRGQYAGQSNMFSFFVDNSRRIFEKDPGGGLSRGFMVSNSEVGDKSFWVKTFLYLWICGNHNIWGVRGVKELRIPHRGNADSRAFRELEVELKIYAEAGEGEEVQKVLAAKKFVLGKPKDEVLDLVFVKLGLVTKKVAEQALQIAETREDSYGDPYTAWAVGNGVTQIARDLPNADARVGLEQAAGKIFTMAF